ncbi:hypothetical protein [Oryzobacter telluris]|uniref:hypothetical protein n=1 Tax=Oryzobacter telluris TaxID=3149179 RepID=UPI00370D5350
MTEPSDVLERELLALGRALEVDAPPADLADVVLARVTAPVPLRPRPRRRLLAAAVAALVALALVPPVRAAVVELLRIGGVELGRTTTPSPVPSTSRPAGQGLGSLEDARRRVDFRVATATALGTPDRVALLEDGRVVTQTWGDGPTARYLDAFDGTLDWGYLKGVWSSLQPVTVGGRDAVWLDAPHLTQWVDRSGETRSAAARLAGPTLVWTTSGGGGPDVTYRLEGVADLAEALEIARSVR